MSRTQKTLLVVGTCVGVIALGFAALIALFYFSMVSTVITKPSPDRQHTAKLTRVQGIDVNFSVTVDGTRVYTSPDFAPTRADFREQLIWDNNSTSVVLEIEDRRIFGYNVDQKRPLTDTELQQVLLTPFEELGFEGKLPSEIVTE